MIGLSLRYLRKRAGLRVVLFTVLALNSAARGQDTHQVHVAPLPDPPSTTASITASDLKLHLRTLHVEVDLVLVPVTVTDALNRPVIGLGKDNFELLDGGRKQQIRFFSSEDAPLSIALVLDVSNSMRNRISIEREALSEFFNNANSQDEYFAIAVSNRPIVLADSVRNIGDIQAKLASLQPAGYTALMDSIYLALQKMRSARYARRAILIISDGGENDSRYKAREIKELAAESDVLIYAIRPYDALPFFRTIEEKLGNRVLSGITDITGGRTISLGYNDNLARAAAAISLELRNQYVLGYLPAVASRDGKWHNIKVYMARRDQPAPLQLHYKKGYSAPKR